MKFAFGNLKQPEPILMGDDRPLWKQVHGVTSVEVTQPSQVCGDVDALWTQIPAYPIGIVTADCVPLLLCRNDERAVAAIHAGWRGTIAKIVEAFYKQLPTDLAKPGDWAVKLGPCIRACCYEVSPELIEEFKMAFRHFEHKTIEPTPRKLDLVAIHRETFRRLGVEIDDSQSECTFCTRDAAGEFKYYSYRRGDRQTRQYSVIVK